MVTILVAESCDNALISITDDRGVVSDCADIVKIGGCFVPIGIERDLTGNVTLRWCLHRAWLRQNGTSGPHPGCDTSFRQQ